MVHMLCEGANKENQQPDNDQHTNSEEAKNQQSNATGDATQSEPNKTTVSKQADQPATIVAAATGAGDISQQP
jgi:hypothetical protein